MKKNYLKPVTKMSLFIPFESYLAAVSQSESGWDGQLGKGTTFEEEEEEQPSWNVWNSYDQ